MKLTAAEKRALGLLFGDGMREWRPVHAGLAQKGLVTAGETIWSPRVAALTEKGWRVAAEMVRKEREKLEKELGI